MNPKQIIAIKLAFFTAGLLALIFFVETGHATAEQLTDYIKYAVMMLIGGVALMGAANQVAMPPASSAGPAADSAPKDPQKGTE